MLLPTTLCFFMATVAFLPHKEEFVQRQRPSQCRTQKNTDDPCIAAKPFVDTVANFSKTPGFQTALKLIRNKSTSDSAHEHVISLGKDGNGNTLLSAVQTGGKSSSKVPGVSNGFADLHNHPKNTPPSSGDLYGLLASNGKNRTHSMRFVLTASNSLYAFVVTDPAAASLFLRNYPSQQVPGYSKLFPDALLDEYREIQHRYGATEETAMAYVLEKYAAGVSLLKQEGSGSFKKLKAIVTTSGDGLSFKLSYCQ